MGRFFISCRRDDLPYAGRMNEILTFELGEERVFFDVEKLRAGSRWRARCFDPMTEILRYAAFTDRPDGGNPAGVVLDAAGLSDDEMLKIAADLGYSETAFVEGEEIRYFSPLAEVPFCGHATIATGVAIAERDGPGDIVLRTRSGTVPVTTRRGDGGRVTATLTSVPPRTEPLDDLDELLAALGWAPADLDPALEPRVAYAGAWHPIIAAATRERLAALDYDFDRLGALMKTRDWTTVQLVWREDPTRFHSRNPFPPGGVVEDPATGAAAAAFGGYLRELGLVTPPATITILQGEDLGRPGRLRVDIRADRPEIDVTGAAVAID
jgi:PhzF family phenazine biosynthesis protein